MNTITIDNDFMVRTLVDLVRINSSNPSLSSSGRGEAEIGGYVAGLMQDIGLEVQVNELAPGRFNVVGTLPGSGGGKTLLLNAHMDTVDVDGMTIDPFGAEIKNGRLYGRGSQDMKASLAAMLSTVKALVESDINMRGDLLITAVADEEHSSIGTEALVKTIKADAAIVTEPTDMQVCCAHRGFIWFDVETFGKAAHGSRFMDGVDANMHMGQVLSELSKLAGDLINRPAHQLAGPPSLHAARLSGGRELSVYADHCLLQIERRTVPGETVAGAQAELQDILDTLSKRIPDFKSRVNAVFSREPFEVVEDADIVRLLDQAVEQRLGSAPVHIGQTFWTDAALLAEAGIQTAVIGPVGCGLHSAEEWVDLASALDLAYVLADTAIRYCS